MAWKARIEWVLEGVASDGVSAIMASETLSGNGPTVVQSKPAPDFRKLGRGVARITVLSGAVLVSINDPTPTESDSLRLASAPGAPHPISALTDQILYFAEAADPRVTMPVTSSPASGLVDVTPGAADLPGGACRSLLVTVDGMLDITCADGSTPAAFPVVAGQIIPVSVIKVEAGTTATVKAFYGFAG